MKINILSVIIISLFIISCEEGFEPTADFKEDYVMYGIVNGDSTYQSVVISKSYSSDNFDPYSNTSDPDIKDAIVIIKGENKEYFLRDTSVERSSQSQYSVPQHFYYTNEFKPKLGEKIELQAILPNGKVLISKTTMPNYSLFFWSNDDEVLPINRIYNKVLFRWELRNPSPNLIYLPKFLIHYFQTVGGTNLKKTKEVPLNFVKIGNSLQESFPTASGTKYVLYDTTIVYNTLKELKGAGSASDITIIKGEVELTIMDENLGSYYSSIQTLNDGFTIKIYETNYSNINGGIGIWGSYNTIRKDIQILPEFIQSFGYKSFY